MPCLKVQMVSAESVAVFERACEMFLKELAIRSVVQTEDNKRRTMQVVFFTLVCQSVTDAEE
jgi:histone H3/H4